MNADSITIKATKEAALVRHHLMCNPENQAEVIARHYVEQSNMALQILKLLQYRKSERSLALDQLIERLVIEIKNNHRKDFGIDLEWTLNHER